MTDLKKLRALAEKATPGRWSLKTNVHPETNGMSWGFLTGPSQNITWSDNKPSTVRDAEFIATANPQAIIELLDRLERYEKALRFYADEKSWRVTREDELHQAIMTIVGDVDSYGYQRDEWSPNILQIIAGKAAREALEGGK